MAKFLRKKAYYVRTKTAQGVEDITKRLIRRKQQLKNVHATERTLNDVVYRIQHYREDTDAFTREKTLLLHIVSGVIGQTAITMNMACTEEFDDGKEQKAPSQHEFINGEAYLLFKDHHVVFCSHGLTLITVQNYLNSFLHNKDVDDSFEFTNVANIDKLQLLNRNGVKAFNFSASMYTMTQDELNRKADAANRSRISSLFNDFIQNAKNAFSKDLTEEEQKILQELQVDVSVRLIGNSRASFEAQKFVKTEAQEMLADDALPPEVEFITGNDETIKSSEIQLHKTITVQKLNNSNSLQHEDAWLSLSDYFDELKRQKFTEI